MAGLADRPMLGPVARFYLRRREQILYLVVGGWNTLFGYAIWALFYYLLRSHLHYLVIQVIGWPFAVANAYICYRYIVFRSRGSVWRELPRFSLVYVGGLVLTLAVLPILVHVIPFNLYVIQALFTAVVIILTYLAHKYFSFRGGQRPHVADKKPGSRIQADGYGVPVDSPESSHMSTAHSLLARDLRHIIAHTEGLWSGLRRQNVFVTGGTGFIGRWMLESLLYANDVLGLQVRVVVLSRRPDAFTALTPHLAGHPAVTLLEGNVRTFDYPEGEYSHVLHLATESGPSLQPDPGSSSFATSVAGTERVLAFASSHGTTRLLFTSSGAVYGRQPEDCERLSEDWPGDSYPEGAKAGYALGKRAAELLCCTAANESGLQAKIARCFTFVGPYMNFEGVYAIGNFIRDAVCRDNLAVTGDGTPQRSYLYAADMAVWLWTILFAGDKATPYNVGSPEAISIADLAWLVARAAGRGKTVSLAENPPPGRAVRDRYIPDTSRASASLGLKVEIGLEEAIRRTARWYRETCRDQVAE